MEEADRSAWVQAEPSPGFEAQCLQLARSRFESSGSIDPTGLLRPVVGRDLEIKVGVLEGDADHNEAVMLGLKEKVGRLNAKAFAFMAEVWLVERQFVHGDEAEMEAEMEAEPRLSRYRREAVSVTVEQYAVAAGEPRMWRAYIDRSGPRPALAAFELCAMQIGGRATRFLRAGSRSQRRGWRKRT